MRHAYPQFTWTTCNEPPDNCRRVIVWHRCRQWCRFYEIVVGSWNSLEWRQDNDKGYLQGRIYQPDLWRDIETPDNRKSPWL